MAHISEPKGVDFIIESSPLTDKEKKELSEFIAKRKKEREKKDGQKTKARPRKKPTANNV